MRCFHVSVLLACACLAVGCGPDFNNPLDPENSPDTATLIREGWRLYEAKNFTGAETKFRQAVTRDALSAEAHTGLGWSLFQEQDAQGAVAAFQQALLVDPNAVDAHVGIAGAFLATQRHASVVQHAQTALRLQPAYTFAHDPLITHKNLHLLLAQAYFQLGDFTSAVEEVNIIDPTIEIDPENMVSELLQVLEELAQQLNQG